MSYFRKNIEAMDAYVPGEQAAGRGVVKLNTNENPYPPSPLAVEAMRQATGDMLRVYPDAASREFCRAVAAAIGVPAEHVIAANGSDNLLVMIARAAAGPARRIAQPTPTFPFYETQALVENTELINVPCDPDTYAVDVDALIAAQADVTFVANPNSPTGVMASLDELDRLAAGLGGLLVIDEAYADFADANALPLVDKHRNVILLRTLSKGYSLAGLRLGYAVTQPDIIRQLWKTKEIYNVSVPAQLIGAAAMRDQDHKTANADRIRQNRSRLGEQLAERGCRVWPSQANFLMVAVPDGNAAAVCDALKAHDVLVRFFKTPGMEDKLRITVGTPEENAALLKAWDDAERNSEFGIRNSE